MGAFLRFLARFKALWVFIILELVALYIISNQSVFQRSVFAQASMNIASETNAKIGNVLEYLSLSRTNEELSHHNAELQTLVASLQAQVLEYEANAALPAVTDTAAMRYLSAKVVSKDLSSIDKYFVLNRGSSHGVKEGFGVVANGAVVGVVSNVTDRYSAVMLAASSKFPISAKVKRDSTLCTVIWNGNSRNMADVSGIPIHSEIKPGDTIITSGYSSIFPENYRVGMVTRVSENRETSSKDLKVLYLSDFSKLNYVQVIIFRDLDEINKIKEDIEQ